MRAGKCLSVSSADIRRLKAVVQDRNAPQKHVWRAEIVLLTADGVGTNEIMRRTAKSKTCVWRWQERFVEDGFDGLVRDKTRPSRIKPLSAEAAERVVALTLGDPPGETTHWTGASMAKAAGLSVSSVQRIWRAHGLQPHRMRRECQESCVRGRFSHHALTNLSSNMMANWVLASHHSRGGIFHVCATWRKTRYSNLIAASSVGKCPLVRTARRSLAFKDSMAFVV